MTSKAKRWIPSQLRDPVFLTWFVFGAVVVGGSLGFLYQRGENTQTQAGQTKTQVQHLTTRVVKIERGVATRCVAGNSLACSRLLAALLRDATPSQRKALATGVQLVPRGVVIGGGNNNPSGQPGPPGGGSQGGSGGSTGGGSPPPSPVSQVVQGATQAVQQATQQAQQTTQQTCSNVNGLTGQPVC